MKNKRIDKWDRGKLHATHIGHAISRNFTVICHLSKKQIPKNMAFMMCLKVNISISISREISRASRKEQLFIKIQTAGSHLIESFDFNCHDWNIKILKRKKENKCFSSIFLFCALGLTSCLSESESKMFIYWIRRFVLQTFCMHFFLLLIVLLASCNNDDPEKHLIK